MAIEHERAVQAAQRVEHLAANAQFTLLPEAAERLHRAVEQLCAELRPFAR